MTLPHDHQIADWLADDASEGPADSLARALAATRRTRKRPRWTFPSMWLPTRLTRTHAGTQHRPVIGQPWTDPIRRSTLTKLTVGAVVAAAVSLAGFTLLRGPSAGPVASPSPTASPSPISPPPLTERFDSRLHGISIDYPSGWQERPATQLWNDRFVPGFDSPTGDVIFDPALREGLYVVLTSSRGKRGSVDEWHGLTAWPGLCDDETDQAGPSHVPYILEGARGYLFTSRCRSGGAILYGAELATDSRGYIVYLYVGSGSSQARYDKAWFEAALETVALRPQEAFDAS